MFWKVRATLRLLRDAKAFHPFQQEVLAVRPVQATAGPTVGLVEPGQAVEDGGLAQRRWDR